MCAFIAKFYSAGYDGHVNGTGTFFPAPFPDVPNTASEWFKRSRFQSTDFLPISDYTLALLFPSLLWSAAFIRAVFFSGTHINRDHSDRRPVQSRTTIHIEAT